LRAGGKGQQLLIVLRGERQFADGLGAERLTGRGIRRFDAGDLRGNLYLLGQRTRLESDGTRVVSVMWTSIPVALASEKPDLFTTT